MKMDTIKQDIPYSVRQLTQSSASGPLRARDENIPSAKKVKNDCNLPCLSSPLRLLSEQQYDEAAYLSRQQMPQITSSFNQENTVLSNF